MVSGGVVVNYTNAARRHFDDANSLQQAGRLGNAGQLYGYAAECGVKALMVSCGASVDGAGSVLAPLRLHFPKLRNNVQANLGAWVNGRGAAACFAALPSLGKLNDWNIDYRYWHLNKLPLQSLADWKVAASEVMRALDGAI